MQRKLIVATIVSLMSASASPAPVFAGVLPFLLGSIGGLSMLPGIFFDLPQYDANRAFLTLSPAGYYSLNNKDFAKHLRSKSSAVELDLEYKPDFQTWRLKPIMGIYGTNDAGFGVYAGFSHDLFIGQHFVFSFSSAATIYNHGRGKDLGSIALLRSGLAHLAPSLGT